MIKAIIFDCFGVLATDTWPELRDRYFRDDDSRRRIEALRDDIDAGLIDRSVFVDAIRAHTGMTAIEVDAFVQANEPNKALLDHIAELKGLHKIGVLSNVSGDRTPELFGDKRALFDSIILSCNIGVTKPDERAYHIAAEQLDVEPGECVFIDDRPENVAAARRAGMIGIEYTNFDELKRTLEKVLR